MPPAAAAAPVTLSATSMASVTTASAIPAFAIQAGIGFGLSAVSFAVQNFVLKDKGTFGNVFILPMRN